jgi:hypothetical protein
MPRTATLTAAIDRGLRQMPRTATRSAVASRSKDHDSIKCRAWRHLADRRGPIGIGPTSRARDPGFRERKLVERTSLRSPGATFDQLAGRRLAVRARRETRGGTNLR